jgi:hypothetical protein
MSSRSLWQRFHQHFFYYRDLGFSLDISRMKFPDDFLEKMQPKKLRVLSTPDPEDVFHVLRHLASNDPRIRVSRGDEPTDDQFSCANSNS